MSNSIKLLIIAFIAAIVLTVIKGEDAELFGPNPIDKSYAQNETIYETVTSSFDETTEESTTEESVWVSPEYQVEMSYNSKENQF